MLFSIRVTGTKCNNPICIFQEMLSTMDAQFECYIEVIIEGLITCRRSVTDREYSTEKNYVFVSFVRASQFMHHSRISLQHSRLSVQHSCIFTQHSQPTFHAIEVALIGHRRPARKVCKMSSA